MGIVRRILRRIWADRGYWDYTTRGSQMVTAPPAPRRSQWAEKNAQETCRRFGHSEFHGTCLVCYSVLGELTMQDVVPEAQEAT